MRFPSRAWSSIWKTIPRAWNNGKWSVQMT